MKSNSDNRFVDFDFKDASARKKIEDWLRFTRNSLKDSIELQKFELQKISEFLDILIRDSVYKIPKNRAKRSHSWKELICWYVIKTERESPELSKARAKEITASKFCVSTKTVERYCSEKRKSVESLIEECGFSSVSDGYKRHLYLIKKEDVIDSSS